MHMRNRRHISDLLVRSVQNEIGVPRASACGLDCLRDTFLKIKCGVVERLKPGHHAEEHAACVNIVSTIIFIEI